MLSSTAAPPFDRIVEKKRKRRRKLLRRQLTRMKAADVDDELRQVINKILKGLKEIDPLTKHEAREMLISLRERMMAEHPEVPRKQELLRRQVLQQILYYKISNERELRRWLGSEMKFVHPSLLVYLPNIFKITSRIQQRNGPDMVEPEEP